ncbi:methyl-accepting chemotaxis protein [Clostridium sp. Mt-5]|uniref:Methyl-accepting chemotaxis protein n=1 Tax=Clostridium moutaii TaxID=3240932 RepID=A0ABV4BSN4_9CLOT
MISINALEDLKKLAETQADLIPGGIVYGIINGDTMEWVQYSKSLNINVFYVGQKLREDSITRNAIREKKTLTQKIPRSVYGTRLDIISIPIVDETGKATGAFSMAFPRLHPVAGAFDRFAPILSQMFPEGVFLCLTDLEKFVKVQSSKKFDIPSIKVGDKFESDFLSGEVIKTGKEKEQELDALKFGIPVRNVSFPLIDEDTNDVVGTFSIITPREVAVNLKDMSGNLTENITGISSAIEELAASASQIHTNEQELNSDINKIIKLSEEINEVTSFIESISDETKMLGLNAAIEAARAGQAGSGFGVVANEIRKLSDQAKSTVPKIKKLTDDIKDRVEESSEKSKGSLSSSQEQAAATEEITASIEEITTMSERLNEIARKL